MILLIVFEFLLFFFVIKHEIFLECSSVSLYATTPIVPIALIAIFLSIGTFRGFKDNDMESILKKTPYFGRFDHYQINSPAF